MVMLKWLKRKIRLVYRLLILGWHTTVEHKVNTNQWSVVDRKSNLIFTSRYFELEEEANRYIEFYELSEGIYLHLRLTITNLIKSFNRFAVSDEKTEIQEIFRKFDVRCVFINRPVTKLKYKYVRTNGGKRKRVYIPENINGWYWRL
jgi:hypothetical protein